LKKNNQTNKDRERRKDKNTQKKHMKGEKKIIRIWKRIGAWR